MDDYPGEFNQMSKNKNVLIFLLLWHKHLDQKQEEKRGRRDLL